ncbi:hypothetical protein EG68_07849 [Paragonimus skrjabini miyazakii]|uniref:Uncharacterized protein n=1 Tax=Paragonimus skrjabini miyazakii TaxID=59628 RepID=A0A8S9YKW5_9TREM|nr:hypothetical protein EG68_07849 [Paragonimus skrjabini miyazakii]
MPAVVTLISSCAVKFCYNTKVLAIEYCRKNQGDSDKLPTLRSWSSRSLSWKPEKIDHPLRVQQTGAYLSRNEDCGNKIAEVIGGDYIRAFINMIILIFMQVQNKLPPFKNPTVRSPSAYSEDSS